jgi:GrpB-like predicted nucleotidyltransferase (UPF0157 family)
MLGFNKDKQSLVIVPYDPKWVDYFNAEKANLTSLLHDLDVKIEHYGSTSVPKMWAKPIIDISIAVKNPWDMDTVAQILSKHGYQIHGLTDNNIKLQMAVLDGEITANRLDKNGNTVSHVHIHVANSMWHLRAIIVRDYLRKFPTAAAEYSKLKQQINAEISKKFPNGTKFGEYTDRKNNPLATYQDLKAQFVLQIREKAFKYYNVKQNDELEKQTMEIWLQIMQKWRAKLGD